MPPDARRASTRSRFRVGMQGKGPRTRGFGGLYSRYFAAGFALRRCQNSIRRYSAVLKREFRTQFPLLPLDGFSSAVPSFQLSPVFGAVSNRVPPGDTMSRFVSPRDKSWDNFKNYFQTQGLEFSLLSQGARRIAFRGSISTKTPALKLKCLFACEPPAAIGSESTQVAFKWFAKLQIAGLHC